MEAALLHPAYCPDLLVFAQLVQRPVCWELHDHYQKQTYRNRCYIYTDQGKQMLNIPIRHVGGPLGRQNYRDVLLDNSYHWQRDHWRALQTAYRASPFFEYYEDDLKPLFHTTYEKLLEFNLESIHVLANCLGLEMNESSTETYEKDPANLVDLRTLVNAKQPRRVEWPPYHQVFEEKHGFIPGLSLLDLLFNLGPASMEYLEKLPNLHA